MSGVFSKVQAQHYKLLFHVSNAILAVLPEIQDKLVFWTTKLTSPGCLTLGNYNDVKMI